MADFDNIMVSLSGILERIDRGEGTLGMLVTNDELFFTLREAVESARILMDDLKENPSRYINISIF
jgi:phospholipid/cholesterol/gamma-HCH transport system substrate-binding protein